MILLGKPGWILCKELDPIDQWRIKTAVFHDEDEAEILEVLRYGFHHSYYKYSITEVIESTREHIWISANVIERVDFRGIEWSSSTSEDYMVEFEKLFGREPHGIPMRELLIRE